MKRKKFTRGKTKFYQASSSRAMIPPGFCKSKMNVKE